MGRRKIKIGVLTSSRADYGIYLPLLKVMQVDDSFTLSIIAFGTHLSTKYGYTVDNIIEDGFSVDFRIKTSPKDDTPAGISKSIGRTIKKFADFYAEYKFDLILALGDRYEMFAAVSASVPFNVKIGHIHGGESTIGAIDNCFRHAITSMSSIHFTSNQEHLQRVQEITGSANHVYNTGALSLDNINALKLLSIDEFQNQYGIDLKIPSILITFHPETVNAENNERYSEIAKDVIKELSKQYQLIITMSNADTYGSLFRQKFLDQESNKAIFLIENFGTIGYFSCMRECVLVLGNSSSGIIESASFNKYCVNVGDRQKGRIANPNVVNVAFSKRDILNEVRKAIASGPYAGSNRYYNGGASRRIAKGIKNEIYK